MSIQFAPFLHGLSVHLPGDVADAECVGVDDGSGVGVGVGLGLVSSPKLK